MNLNRVLLIGRLTADPEVRTTASGQHVASIRLATNRVWNDPAGNRQEQTEFHSIVAWGKLAETAQKYLQKGQLACFEGRLQTRSWQAQDGAKRYTTEVVAESLNLGPRASGVSNPNYSKPEYSKQTARNESSVPIKKSPANDKQEDIPVINEDFPVASPIVANNDFEEAEIDLKDIPF